MNLTLSSRSRIRASSVLWGYAVFKFWIASGILAAYGINPWIFLFLDMVTVPPYVIGWNRLFVSLASKQDTQTLKTLVLWGMITFVSSTAPYLYAAGKKNIKAMSFTGGEPLLLLDDLCDYINRAGKDKIPFIRTGTNGFLFTRNRQPGFSDKISRLAERLAATPIRNFWISVDSCDPKTHETMRGLKGVIPGIRRSIPLFHEAGLFPVLPNCHRLRSPGKGTFCTGHRCGRPTGNHRRRPDRLCFKPVRHGGMGDENRTA